MDFVDYAVQVQPVVDAFRSGIANTPPSARRLAIVTRSALLRMQLKRMIGRDGVMFFESLAEAERWLEETSSV
ncbi:hypothetical protein EBBID32_1700 [Sphingobium indicum BiD32]|uniref:STAS/SEC14 domain-containing protein n=1 Tax=Sphingobium indicum BiD32 TaxID=1301087 RepID=N1MJL1_9SPHN|nr:hypothetical protein [Sphingobium indicum]CCW15842.1 hypothetical protein EBBID32_1700 [Sphingobium indicum BiD32]